jgi:hypothetical protein
MKPGVSMLLLKIRASINPDKLPEFELAMDQYIKEDSSVGVEAVYEQIDDKKIICILGTWKSREDVSTYLESERHQYLMGALTVLGNVTSAEIFHVEHMENVTH